MERNPFPDTERRAQLAKELGMDKKRWVYRASVCCVRLLTDMHTFLPSTLRLRCVLQQHSPSYRVQVWVRCCSRLLSGKGMC